MPAADPFRDALQRYADAEAELCAARAQLEHEIRAGVASGRLNKNTAARDTGWVRGTIYEVLDRADGELPERIIVRPT